MNSNKISRLSVERLVQKFSDLAVLQDQPLLSGAQGDVNKIFQELQTIVSELKARQGDQRSALLSLYDHKNMQVRLKAAKATLAITPQMARAQLEAIRKSRWQPQAGEAGMSLINLESGIYKPT